jgi:Zn-dependent oligopeptidase
MSDHTRLHRAALALALCPLLSLLPTTASAAVLGADTGLQLQPTAAELAATCKSTLDDARSAIKRIDERAGKPVSFADGLGAIEGVVGVMYDKLLSQLSLSFVATAKDVRDAASACTDSVAAFGVEVSVDPAVYALAQAGAKQATDPEDQRLALIYMENGRHAGAHLDEPRRLKVKALLDQLNTLQIEFQRAVAEDKAEIELQPAEVAPLTDALKAQLSPGEHGQLLRVGESTITPFMQSESLREARLRFRTIYDRRGGQANADRLARGVALRQQIARQLGYRSWADLQLESKMAKSPKRAMDLVTKVNHTLLPKARAEIAVLTQLKKADGDNTPLELWDYAYCENRLEKTRYAIDQDAIRPYFPVDKVVPAVLDIYARLLGIRFERLADVKSWAPQVDEYAIYDAASGEAMGWLFLDLFPREGKYGHFQSGNFRLGRQLADGGYQLPVAVMMGNWPTPEPGKPALLSHDEVVTFFHEFGHGMHQTLSHTRYATLYGSNTRVDFVEAPSQMLENWMWQPSVLKKVSSNVKTGEPLPDELIQKMIAARHVADGVFWTRQTFFGAFDLQIHSMQGTVDPTALWFSLRPKMTLLHDIPGTWPSAAFEHLMGGGYDAGYYGYLWSKVYAQDMFSEFRKAGLDTTDVGMRYRREILLPGGSAEPDVLLQRFLGRPVSFKPFYEDLGMR